jgi:hypothetical protein
MRCEAQTPQSYAEPWLAALSSQAAPSMPKGAGQQAVKGMRSLENRYIQLAFRVCVGARHFRQSASPPTTWLDGDDARHQRAEDARGVNLAL